jgi:hypothetical protein
MTEGRSVVSASTTVSADVWIAVRMEWMREVG